jgi:hypothetical protein
MKNNIFSKRSERFNVLDYMAHKGLSGMCGYFFTDREVGLDLIANMACDMSHLLNKKVIILTHDELDSKHIKAVINDYKSYHDENHIYVNVRISRNISDVKEASKEHDVVIISDIKSIIPDYHATDESSIDSAIFDLRPIPLQDGNTFIVAGYIPKPLGGTIGMQHSPGENGNFEMMCQQLVCCEEFEGNINCKVLKDNKGQPKSFKLQRQEPYHSIITF